MAAHPATAIHELVDGGIYLVSFSVVFVILARRARQQRSVAAHELIELILIGPLLLVRRRFVLAGRRLCLRATGEMVRVEAGVEWGCGGEG